MQNADSRFVEGRGLNKPTVFQGGAGQRIKT